MNDSAAGLKPNKSIHFEQYKLYIEMADRISSRRIEVNRFYVTILTALIAVVSFIANAASLEIASKNTLLLCVGLFGILLCVIWFINIRVFRDINAIKFEIINELESQFTFQGYKLEWEKMQNNGSKYFQFTKIESLIPLLLSLPFLVLMITALFGLFAP